MACVQLLGAGSIRQGVASCSERLRGRQSAQQTGPSPRQRCLTEPTKSVHSLVRPCFLTCVLLWGAAAAPALLWPARHRQDVHRARDRAAAVRVRALLPQFMHRVLLIP